jgi:hypothetical protein
VGTTSSTTLIATTSAAAESYDCSILPPSMNGVSHPAGCSGAVWSNGAPSRNYCEGGFNGTHALYPWWSACCKWEGEICTEKEGTATVAPTTTLFQDCTSLPPSMNGVQFSFGCSGAVWSNGAPSESYCLGAKGMHPWWSVCCYWDGSGCKEREGTTVAPDCAALPISMNGVSFPRGCSGAVWSSGSPSKTYCQGSQGKYLWWAACCQWDGISSACIAKAPAPGGRRLARSAWNASEALIV